jgi:hypothetical protein
MIMLNPLEQTHFWRYVQLGLKYRGVHLSLSDNFDPLEQTILKVNVYNG